MAGLDPAVHDSRIGTPNEAWMPGPCPGVTMKRMDEE
jgi:hypothetical protein